MNHRIFLTLGVVVSLLGSVGAALPAETRPVDPRALRRTPIVEVFEKWSDTVVCVTGPTVKDDRPTLEEFFAFPNMKPLETRIGTGFIVHESGYIVVNAHAADRIVTHSVILADRQRYPAELVGSLRGLDLALLKVEAGRPLHAVRIGLPGDVMIGETIVVVGNPQGLLRTCTTGVISAVSRISNVADLAGVTLTDLIQSDAGINPGSSGGPWFNILGEVVGVTASMKRDSENIGFAISAATLRRALPGLLGVEPRYGLATGLTLTADGPSKVLSVAPNSPAASAGLQAGDVIEKVGELPTPTATDYHLAWIGRKAGQPVPLSVLREGKPLALAITPAARPKPDGLALASTRLGLTLAPLEPERVKAMALRVPRGAVVAAADPARFATIQHKPEPGDVLVRIGRVRPRDLDHLGQLLEQVPPGQPVPMVFARVRGQVATRIDVTIPAP